MSALPRKNQPAPASVSRKELARQQTSQNIIKALTSLMITKPVREISMEEVAAAALLGKGTLYNYFGNRDGLLTAVIKHFFDVYFATVDPILTQDAPFRERFRLLVETSLATMEGQTGLFQLLKHIDHELNATLMPGATKSKHLEVVIAFHIKFRDFYATAIRRKEIRGGDPIRISMAVTNLMINLHFSGLIGLGQRNTKENVRFLQELFLV